MPIFFESLRKSVLYKERYDQESIDCGAQDFLSSHAEGPQREETKVTTERP